jgi:hypothetical protein
VRAGLTLLSTAAAATCGAYISHEGVDSELRWDIRNDSPTCELALQSPHRSRLKKPGAARPALTKKPRARARKAVCVSRSEKVLSVLQKHGRDG